MKDKIHQNRLRSPGASGGRKATEPSDADLISRVRAGETEYYSELYRRHVGSVTTVALRHVDNPSDADDMVAEAFASTLEHLINGKGPDSFFRAYILSVVTRQSQRRNQKASRALATDNMRLLDRGVEDESPVERSFETAMVADSFASLPERWRAVLWYIEVERMKPAQVAPMLGLSPNAVSALAIRAREGLRRSYLNTHHKAAGTGQCASYSKTVAALSRKGMGRKQRKQLEAHAAECVKCAALLTHLSDVQTGLGGVLAPAIAGIPASQLQSGGLTDQVRNFFSSQSSHHVAVAGTVASVVVAAVIVACFVQSWPIASQAEGPAADSSPATVLPEAAQSFPAGEPHPAALPVPDSSAVADLMPPAAPAPVTPLAEPSTPVPAVPATPPEPTPLITPATDNVLVPSSGVLTSDPLTRTTSLYVNFAVVGDHPLAGATVTFAAGDGVTLRSAPQTPPGWLCSGFSPESPTVTCTTGSADVTDLSFVLTTVADAPASQGQLTYEMSGQGMKPVSGIRQL